MQEYLLYWRLGYTMDEDSFVNRRIRYITKGPAHVFIHGYKAINGTAAEDFYFESIWTKDPATGKTGVRGPIPLSNVIDWRAADPDNRTIEYQPKDGYLPLTQDEAWDAWHRLNQAVRTVKYAPLQLVQNWMARRLGIYIHKGIGSTSKWTCSETPLRAGVIPARWWDIFNMLSLRADDMWPGGVGYQSLHAGVARVIAKHGTIENT